MSNHMASPPNSVDVTQNSLDSIESHIVGFVDYNDLDTATTAIVIPNTSTYISLTNDGLGAFTNKLYLPSGVTDVWDVSLDAFDWSELTLGDMVDIRLDIIITTANNNQEVVVALELGTGGFSYEIPYAHLVFKSAGTYQINKFNGIYMGDSNTLDNGGHFKVLSDGNATVVVNGWYCRIIKK